MRLIVNGRGHDVDVPDHETAPCQASGLTPNASLHDYKVPLLPDVPDIDRFSQ
jgi:hypothetical protein